MSELRKRVARAIYTSWQSGFLPYSAAADMNSPEDEDWRDVADAAITAVIEALAAEAEAGVVHAFRDPNDGRRSTRRNIGPAMADWLRAHLGGTEATE